MITEEQEAEARRYVTRLGKVQRGVFLLMRGAGDDKDLPASPEELDAEDKKGLQDIAAGLIKIWDGLNG